MGWCSSVRAWATRVRKVGWVVHDIPLESVSPVLRVNHGRTRRPAMRPPPNIYYLASPFAKRASTAVPLFALRSGGRIGGFFYSAPRQVAFPYPSEDFDESHDLLERRPNMSQRLSLDVQCVV